MVGVACASVDGSGLLAQIELILKKHDLIDEVGFVHPSQLQMLYEDSGNAECSDNNRGAFSISDYDRSAFWNNNHKLAISIEVLPHLYLAAQWAYKDVKNKYGLLGNSPSRVSSDDIGILEAESNSFLEFEILNHTRALLILSCDFGSAWNLRKLVLSRRQNLSLYMDELKLSRLILSYSPKSGCAWNHRRWVIKSIAKDIPNLQEIIVQESELVKDITEKFKMNYRAWNHRCWLVTYMEQEQVLEELSKSSKWAELHVADNSCFHYRRRLMLKALEVNHANKAENSSTINNFEMCFLWKEELDWNKLLIRRFIGREALWVHRRFLSQYWIKHLSTSPEEQQYKSINVFLDEELQLLGSCFNALSTNDEFEDTGLQARYAAAYAIWLLKQAPPILVEVREKIEGLEILMRALHHNPPLIWEDLLRSGKH